MDDTTQEKKGLSHTSKALALVILILVSVTAGYAFGKHRGLDAVNVKGIDSLQPTVDTSSADFAPFWQVWKDVNDKFLAVSTTSEKVVDQDRVWGAISGMVASLGDPYTTFFPPQESKEFNEDISGNFGGIGVEIGVRDGKLTVIAPLKDTPGYKAGLKTGDVIVAVDGTPTANMTADAAVKIIRGEIGTKVTLTVLPLGKDKVTDVIITRAVIQVPATETQLRKDGVFVIHLFSFSAQSAFDFRKAIEEFAHSGSHKLVLDLRNNPGGYLDAAVDMASWFLPAGKTVAIEDFKNKEQQITYKSKGYDIFGPDLKMVILINGGSASASEILSGALSENGIATLMGEKSFGKGTVQELLKVTSNTSLKVTIARWLTPSGKSISGNGLEPDIEAKPSENDTTDTVLEKAVEFLNN